MTSLDITNPEYVQLGKNSYLVMHKPMHRGEPETSFLFGIETNNLAMLFASPKDITCNTYYGILYKPSNILNSDHIDCEDGIICNLDDVRLSRSSLYKGQFNIANIIKAIKDYDKHTPAIIEAVARAIVLKAKIKFDIDLDIQRFGEMSFALATRNETDLFMFSMYFSHMIH